MTVLAKVLNKVYIKHGWRPTRWVNNSCGNGFLCPDTVAAATKEHLRPPTISRGRAVGISFTTMLAACCPCYGSLPDSICDAMVQATTRWSTEQMAPQKCLPIVSGLTMMMPSKTQLNYMQKTHGELMREAMPGKTCNRIVAEGEHVINYSDGGHGGHRRWQQCGPASSEQIKETFGQFNDGGVKITTSCVPHFRCK